MEYPCGSKFFQKNSRAMGVSSLEYELKVRHALQQEFDIPLEGIKLELGGGKSVERDLDFLFAGQSINIIFLLHLLLQH